MGDQRNPPPKSQVPRHSDKSTFATARPGFQTGVVPQNALGWPTLPGVAYNGVITMRYFLDWGPMFDEGSSRTSRPRSPGVPSIPSSSRRWTVTATRWPASGCRPSRRQSRRPRAGRCAAPASRKTNAYASLIHANALPNPPFAPLGGTYAFGFDDNCNQSSLISDLQNPSAMSITVDPF